ncbi:EamA family transporter RarD [Mariniluteicoccus flavus]
MTTPEPGTAPDRGVLAAGGAYLIWGLFPLYWPLLARSGAVEILAHRIAWSAVVGALLLAILARGWRAKVAARRTRALVGAASVLIAINWGVYIWAVNNGHVTEAALGYYINPIFSILLGVVFLGERLAAVQWAAIALAAAAVVVLTVDLGRPPWIALALATSFGCYGLIKKQVGLDGIVSFSLESLALGLPAAAYLIWLGVQGHGDFGRAGPAYSGLLVTTGVITAVPLLLFAYAAPRIALSTMGMMQYIAPTLQFALGVWWFGEPMPAARWVGFVLVWIALVVLTAYALTRAHRARRARRLTTG